MFRLDIAVAVALGGALGGGDRLVRFLGKPVGIK
jgi:hypothetical protein